MTTIVPFKVEVASRCLHPCETGTPIVLYKFIELRSTKSGAKVHVWAGERPGISHFITSMPKDMVFVCLEHPLDYKPVMSIYPRL